MPEKNATTSLSDRLTAIAAIPVVLFFRLFEAPFRLVQKIGGLKAMPYVFLLPNLAFFGVFVVVPLFINFSLSLYEVQNHVQLSQTPRKRPKVPHAQHAV
ncbi:MAG TPA: hypothetical protein EYP31_07270, partial [Roseibacterium sp.]|nr:hypothetical protein [Roseibacterium sp.]